MQKLRTQMKKNLKNIENFYKTADGEILKSDAFQTVADNIEMICCSLRDFIACDKKTVEKLSSLFFRIKLLFPHAILPEMNTFINRLKAERLSLEDCGNLPVLLFALFSFIIGDCAEKIMKKNGGENEQIIINAVNSLLKLKDVDFKRLFVEISACERLLEGDPAGIYEKMSEETKVVYRKAVVSEALKRGIDECEFVKEILEKSEKNGNLHIGFYLSLVQSNRLGAILFYVCEVLFSVLIGLVFVYFFCDSAFCAFISSAVTFLPLFAVLKPVSDRISSKIFSVKPLMSMDFTREIDNENEVLITVSSLLPSAEKTDLLYENLANLYCSNKVGKVRVMMLCDLKNHNEMKKKSDEKDILAAKGVIEKLNEDFGGGFVFAVRPRVYSSSEKEYTGFERKRGAIIALVKFLRYADSGEFSLICGDVQGLRNVKYLLALDSDTKLSFDVVKKLVAVAEHPLNEPEINIVKRKVERGYAVFVPRITSDYNNGEKSLFSCIFTHFSSSHYDIKVSERYMDMFGCSLFTGKGLINVDAFDKCICDTFENGYILSHDILEGALLRTAFVGECEFRDSFPNKVSSFFARQSRWVRGDVQNLKYIFSPVTKKYAGVHLPILTKYQLADNFRRIITPFAAFVCIILSAFVPEKDCIFLLSVAMLSFCSESIFSGVVSLFSDGVFFLRNLKNSTGVPVFMKDFLRAFILSGLSVQTVFVNLDAVIRSAYRSLISKKHLLQWTTAADSEKNDSQKLLYPLVLPVLTSAYLLVFSCLSGKIWAVIILLTLPLSFVDLKINKKTKYEINEEEKQILYSYAEQIWKYFEKFVTPEENFLPPDNVNVSSGEKIAHRTSPTNIGLYLVSVIAAADFSFIESSQVFERINNTIETVEKLKKYKGNLYNWYNTEDLTVMEPEYISVVDSGNFLCCLTALRYALNEYAQKDERFFSLVEKAESILSESDLSSMYSEQRGHFHIGFDVKNNILAPSYYDLYISEARMTSFYNVAKRKIPLIHWKNLDRKIAKSENRVGAASWTGTMFEYYMSTLFLPVRENSLEDISLRFCLEAQKRRVGKYGIPYGISESQFYEFDEKENYLYKAHGVKTAAVNKKTYDELVISPYSTFLTLPFSTQRAMKNLKILCALGVQGEYGFYEAVDFEKQRTDKEKYCIVRSFMAHHLGMSMVALANTVFADIFVKRFICDPEIKSALPLLNETFIPIKSRK